MVETNRDGENVHWAYLIRPDKSATPLFEQLCLGLAHVICTLEPGPKERLTPQRLAAFYRSVGGDLDEIFMRTSHSGLSFLYRTIGCYHSLEHTENPFETPSIPCLTPAGFVKWQTVHLLLCPEEHMRYLQEAVRVYNVPRPDGGDFPKIIPDDVFPNRPDVAMEAWHKQVTSQLNQDYMRRLKSSPYQSPNPSDRDGYFGPNLPRVQRPARPPRQDSRDDSFRAHDARRRSEPDFSSPPDSRDYSRSPNAYPKNGRRRSQSANKPSPGSRQRSATTGHAFRPYVPNPSSQRQSSNHLHDHPASSSLRGQYSERPYRTSRERSTSQSSESRTSVDDSSSDGSIDRRKSRRLKSPQTSESLASSLLSAIPFTPWHRRSRSHDTTDAKDKPVHRRDPGKTPRASADGFRRQPPAVRFRKDMFDEKSSANSDPEFPASDSRAQPMQRPVRNPGLTDPVSPSGYNTSRPASGSNLFDNSAFEQRPVYDSSQRQFRKAGQPVRVSTVTGVQGRRYANADPSKADTTSYGPAPADARVRHSLAA